MPARPLLNHNAGNSAVQQNCEPPGSKEFLLTRRQALVTTLLIVLMALAAQGETGARAWGRQGQQTDSPPSQPPQQPSFGTMSEYLGKTVAEINLPGISDHERDHLLSLIAQKVGQSLDRDDLRASIRTLYATGRFADIQVEASLVGAGVALNFVTAPNYFVGAIDAEGAPDRPNTNQIMNASKFQLGELHSQEKLDRALNNIRQLMQENGYYRARVTAESTANAATQQVDILFHITPGAPAHVGEVRVDGSSGYSSDQVRAIAHMRAGVRVTSARATGALQRLRKKYQKQSRELAQVSVAEQTYRPESNVVDYTFEIDPGPLVSIFAQGFHISRSVMKKEVPVYEENALDDDLLNEGQRNLLDYMQGRGYFDATVNIKKENDAKTLHVTYLIAPGQLHKLEMVEITGNKNFMDPAALRARMQVQVAGHFLSHGRYSAVLLKSDVSNLEALYRSNGFREVKIQGKVDDNYKGRAEHLVVHLQIEEGPQTLVGALQITGNNRIPKSELPVLDTAEGQPYSEQNLTSDRERVLTFYFDRGFPNATFEVATKPVPGQANRTEVIYTIQEGEQFFVNQVMLSGLEHTRPYVVQRELQVRTGQPLSQQALLDTQTKLYDLGIFGRVDTAVQNPEGTDPNKNVLVQTQEAKRYTFSYGVGLEFQTGQPDGTTAPQGNTGVSPRVAFDVTRLNFLGRDQTITFQSHVGRLQQRGLVSYDIPKLFDNEKFKLILTLFYDNSLDVATFTSQRLEGKIDVHQQISKVSSLTYRFDYRRVRASNFADDFTSGLVPLLSLPARVGGPGFTFIRDKRDNPLESTKGNYTTIDGFAASSYFGSEADFGRVLAQNTTYQAFGGKGRAGHQFVFARSTSVGLEQNYRNTVVLPPGACPLNQAGEPTCSDISVIPLPELFFGGGGNSHRGFGLNQAGPRDPDSGFPVGGTALFVNNLEVRFPPLTLPYLGEGFGLAIFHDMGNVFTTGHDMLKGLGRWHQPDPSQCLPPMVTANVSVPVGVNAPNAPCLTRFNSSGYDYTSHAVGMGLRYKTPIGPLRFDFGYNLNPTRYVQAVSNPLNGLPENSFTPQHLRHFNVFFSIGQPF
jgi:outer membrane protein insertion porin family